MYLFPCPREDLIQFIPRGKVGCEIGVAGGGFSQALLKISSPEKLHLIDPWIHQAREDYKDDPNNASNNEQEDRYQHVLTVFNEHIKNGTIEVHREYSNEAVSKFDDGYFDWIYVDGRHSYDGVLEDLEKFAPKLKESGLIIGDDFSNHVPAQNMGFGVIEAVLDFCKKGEFTLFGITVGRHPNYVLVRDENHPAIQNFRAILQFRYPNLIKISGLSSVEDISMVLIDTTDGNETHEGNVINFNL